MKYDKIESKIFSSHDHNLKDIIKAFDDEGTLDDKKIILIYKCK